MAQTAQQADTAFRPTLDANLLQTEFEVDSAASNVEGSLKELIDKSTALSTDHSDKLIIYHASARALRVVLSSWALLPKAGQEFEPGHLIDKFEYGYTAMHAIKPRNNERNSLEYHVVRCMTDEWKNHDELTNANLQGIMNGASKQYLVLMQMIDALESGVEVEDMSPEPEYSTAMYEAELDHPLSTPSKRSKKRKASAEEIEEEGTGAPEERAEILKRAKKGKESAEKAVGVTFVEPNTSSVIASQKQSKRGNFGHGMAIRWNYEEDYWIEQRLREDPSTTWVALSQQHNDRFENTLFNDGRTAMFSMQARKTNLEPTQGTESDVEPEKDSDLLYDHGSVQDDDNEQEMDLEGSSEAEVPEPFEDPEAVEEPESLDSSEDPAGDLDELLGRIEEGERFEDDGE